MKMKLSMPQALMEKRKEISKTGTRKLKTTGSTTYKTAYETRGEQYETLAGKRTVLRILLLIPRTDAGVLDTAFETSDSTQSATDKSFSLRDELP